VFDMTDDVLGVLNKIRISRNNTENGLIELVPNRPCLAERYFYQKSCLGSVVFCVWNHLSRLALVEEWLELWVICSIVPPIAVSANQFICTTADRMTAAIALYNHL
jgi:hypothetical protein